MRRRPPPFSMDELFITVEQRLPGWELLLRNNPDGARIAMEGSETAFMGRKVFMHLSHPDWCANGLSFKAYADTTEEAFAYVLGRALQEVKEP